MPGTIASTTTSKKSTTTSNNKPRHCAHLLSRFRSYYYLHLAYYLLLSLLSGIVIYSLERHNAPLSFIDCLFTAASAHTVTGLGVVDFPATTRATKALCAILICLGGQVAFALLPLVLRRWHYQWLRYSTNNQLPQPQPLLPRLRSLCRFMLTTSSSSEVPFDVLDRKFALYESTGLLIKALLCYAAFFNLLSAAVLGLYAANSPRVQQILQDRQVSTGSFAVFTTLSAFNNAGFSLFPDSLVPFADDPLVLGVAMVLILAGNTAFPILLRWMLVTSYRLATVMTDDDEEEAHHPRKRMMMRRRRQILSLLRHPRLYTTHVFSKAETAVLLLALLITNAFQFLLYFSVHYNNPSSSSSSSSLREKALEMGFTTISTRTAGFNVVSLDGLNPGILICQVLFMYLSSYPLIVAVQSTSVKREEAEVEATSAGLLQEVRGLLSNDVLWLAGGSFLIAFDPSVRLDSLFRVIWEVVSAYGTCGSSLAYPANVSSFSSQFAWPAKVVVIVVMLMGRHRSVPQNIDEAVGAITSRREEQRRRRAVNRLQESGALMRAVSKGHAETVGHCEVRKSSFDGGVQVARSGLRDLFLHGQAEEKFELQGVVEEEEEEERRESERQEKVVLV